MQAGIKVGSTGYVQARSEFQRAHARARFHSVINRILRRCYSLCTLADAAAEIAQERGHAPAPGAQAGHPRLMPGPARLTDVRLDRIIGSLGRADDYTSDFLPRLGSDEERWARVRVALDSLEGVPPIELYEVDGDYYVKDGHHRVSVMKLMRLHRVEAYVSRLVPVG